MDYRELTKLTVVKLRELAHKYEDIKGAVGMDKEQLIDVLSEKMGIQRPKRAVPTGVGRRKLKAEIRALKKERDAAIENRDHDALERIRARMHRKKRRLIRVTRG